MSDLPIPPADPDSTAAPSTAPKAPSAPAVVPVAPLPPVSELDVDELRTSLQGVRQTVNLALAGLIVALASVNVILFQRIAALRGQAVEMRRGSQQMTAFLEDHRTNGVPHFVAFIQEMNRFAAKDPNFAKVLAQFPKFQLPASPTAPPPAGTQPIQF